MLTLAPKNAARTWGTVVYRVAKERLGQPAMSNKFRLITLTVIFHCGTLADAQLPCGKVDAMEFTQLKTFIQEAAVHENPCVSVAIKHLKKYPSESTAMFLTTLLDYRRVPTPLDANRIRAIETAELYPAVGAIVEMKGEAKRALIAYLSQQPMSIVGDRNARLAFIRLYPYRIVSAIQDLRSAATEDPSLERRARLEVVAIEMARTCSPHEMKECLRETLREPSEQQAP